MGLPALYAMTKQEIIEKFQSAGEVPSASIARIGIAMDVVYYSLLAVLPEYSRVRYLTGALAVAGGTYSTTIPGYGQGAGVIGVECPTGTVPKSWLSSDEYEISSDGEVAISTALGTAWTVYYSLPHSITGDETTLTEGDLPSLFKLVAAELYMKLAAYHAETQKPEFSADSVNYQSKTREYLALAKAARESFYRIIGTSERAASIKQGETSLPSPASWRLLG